MRNSISWSSVRGNEVWAVIQVGRGNAFVLSNVVLLTFLGCLVGCGGAPDGMVEVQGTVTWNGQPVESGFVTFVPDKSKSPQAGKIREGQFSFRAYPGTNTVKVHASKKAAYVPSMNQHSFVEGIPPKYNSQSILTEDVQSEGENNFVFDLTGDE